MVAILGQGMLPVIRPQDRGSLCRWTLCSPCFSPSRPGWSILERTDGGGVLHREGLNNKLSLSPDLAFLLS